MSVLFTLPAQSFCADTLLPSLLIVLYLLSSLLGALHLSSSFLTLLLFSLVSSPLASAESLLDASPLVSVSCIFNGFGFPTDPSILAYQALLCCLCKSKAENCDHFCYRFACFVLQYCVKSPFTGSLFWSVRSFILLASTVIFFGLLLSALNWC